MASFLGFTLVAAVIVSQNEAQGVNSGLYGISGAYYQDGPNSLVQYDTKTGKTTTVISGSSEIGTGESLGALDYINSIYYTVAEDNYGATILYAYDLANPSNQRDFIPLPMISSDKIIGTGEAIVSNPLTGDIYVFGRNFSENTEYMVRVSRDSTTQDVTTTIVNTYDEINAYPLISGNPQVYDSKRDAIWITAEYGENSRNDTVALIYIDATSGDILNQIPSNELPIDTALYDPNNDVIVGLDLSGISSGDYSYVLKWIDPVTFQVVKTFDSIENWCDWSSVCSLDLVGDVGYFMIYANPDGECAQNNGTLAGHVMSVNINSGKMIDAPQICMSNEDTCPYDLIYYNS